MIKRGTSNKDRIGDCIFARYLRLTMDVSVDLRYFRPARVSPGTAPVYKDVICNDRNHQVRIIWFTSKNG